MKTKITQAQAEKILMDSLTEADLGDVIYEAARNLFIGFIDSIHHSYEVEGCDDDGLATDHVAWYDDIYDEFATTAYELMTDFLTGGKRFDRKTFRDEFIGRIKKILTDCGVRTLNISDLDTGDSPMVHWGYYEDDTFTLDSIRIGKNGKLYFDSGSAFGDESDTEDSIPTDALVEIAEFLGDHKDDIKELAETD